MDDESASGAAYAALARSLRRRREELVALAEAISTASTLADQYRADHPLEPPVTAREALAAIAECRARAQRSLPVAGDRNRSRRTLPSRRT